MRVIKEEGMRIPAKIWAGTVEESAMAQIRNLCSLPFARRVSIMPDVHCGYGMPIGSVLATEGYVIPNAVGVDIGCGMVAVDTGITDLKLEALKEIIGKIRELVPVGFNHQVEPQMDPKELYRTLVENDTIVASIITRELQKATYQLGTLGGGNHFIELQRGDNGHIWVMVHSGSRNLGKQVADHYNKIAVEINGQNFSSVTEDKQLAFLPIGSIEGQEYLTEMEACLRFAQLNRDVMIRRVVHAITQVTGCSFLNLQPINIHHNYAAMEHHGGRNVMVHRKGATSARAGQLGLIPGSQGTASYVVRGKGNLNSLTSCSHGAGRKMGRGVAQRTLSLEAEQAAMNAKGIIHSVRNVKDLDEAPGSYKDIDVVMSEQEDLVEIVTRLEPLAVVKG